MATKDSGIGWDELSPEKQQAIAAIADEALDDVDGNTDVVTRRNVLQALGTLGVGAALGVGGREAVVGDAAAATPDEIGSNSTPIDALYSQAVDSNELTGGYVGDVRAVCNGEVIASIDPSGTTTPISDARDAIVNSSTGVGTILYPPTTIQEEATYTQTSPWINHIGYGPEVSVVEFTDLSTHGYVWDNAEQLIFSGITVDGSDQANRSAGSAWRWINQPAADFNVGEVHFSNWGSSDPVIHMDTGHVFSSHWRKVRTGSSTGNMLASDDSLGPAFSLANFRASPSSNDTAIRLGDIDASASITDVGAYFGDVNIGGSAGPGIRAKTNGMLIFQNVYDYGDNNGNAKPYMAQFEGTGPTAVNSYAPKNQAPSYDYVIKLGPGTIRDVWLGGFEVPNTLNNNLIDLSAAVGGNYEGFTLAPEGRITNNSGAASGNTGMRSLFSGLAEF